MSEHRLGIDVGGTFTDLLLIEQDSGRVHRHKTLTTSPDPTAGVLSGLARIAAQAGVPREQITHVLHGTTAATNAVLERKGARVALIVTEGFRQVLHLGRGHIPGGLGGWVVWKPPALPASLADTIEARERIDASGKIIRDLDTVALATALRELITCTEIDAFAVSLTNSYVDGRHEQDVHAVLREIGWTGPVFLSSEVVPEQGEYERTLTTVMNAFVAPAVSAYCTTLSERLQDGGSGPTLRILRSDGGLMSVQMAVAQPVNMLLSGPAGGVAGALHLAGLAGYRDLLTLDMGGTSTDVALVEAGRPGMSRETTVGDFTVRSAAIAVCTIGAGGGSIAHVPPLTGALRVGPESAGADPGPAAYGRGGTRPTVTDANVVLGYLADTALAGELEVDADGAYRAIASLAHDLGIEVAAAAAGVVDVVNENMLGALRVVSVQSGHDPRKFALVAFGGAGPLHANALARLLGSWPVVVPPAPGLLCAFGDATTSLRNEASRALARPLSGISTAEIRGVLDELAVTAGAGLDVPTSQQVLRREADLRYQGQRDPLTVSLDDHLDRDGDSGALADLLHAEHERLYTFALDIEPELVNLRVIAESATKPPRQPPLPTGGTAPTAAFCTRRQMWADGREHQAAVYERRLLHAGNQIDGPAIIMEMDSTTVVLPEHRATVDEYGNLIILPLKGVEPWHA